MVAQNMTTLCENWACTAHDAGGGSGNHIMLGGFEPFLHQSIGGLDSAVSGETGGWERIIVRVAPAAIATLGGASNTHETRFGTVSLSWRYQGGQLVMALAVPVGSTAEVHAPTVLAGRALTRMHEGQTVLWSDAAGVAALDAWSVELRESAVVATVGSGTYAFAAQYQ